MREKRVITRERERERESHIERPTDRESQTCRPTYIQTDRQTDR